MFRRSAPPQHHTIAMPLLALALAPALASPAADADADARPPRSNIVLFLTDDQDQMLGASFPTLGDATPMPKARALLAHAGATATRFYAHTPICCPSRAELLTGRYLHNLKVRPAAQPRAVSVCMHVNESRVLDHSFAASLAEAGYHVGMFGKFLNNVPDWTQPARGFSAWLANGGGDYIAPKFGAANLAFAGIEDGEVQYGEDAYTTSIVGNVSNEWIRHVARRQPERPFFAYIAPKAAHEPFIPARWYVDHWDPQWPSSEPRPPNWNCSAALRQGKHGNIATQPMITAEAARVVTGVFKNRWRTLLSVDDLIGDTLATVESLGLLDRTYFFFTSDHGFQLGENNILMDKRHVYDWDTRVHLLVRGPGIRAGSEMAYPATMVDLAPTFLSIAGVTPPATMDGRSLLPLFVEDRGDGRRPLEARGGGIGPRTRLPPDVQQHLHAVGGAKAYRAAWRSEVFLEYYFVDDNDKCVEKCSTTGQWPHADSNCADLPHNQGCWGPPQCIAQCYPTESLANNFIALRTDDTAGSILYAEFATGNQSDADVNFETPDFFELYHTQTDPWLLTNAYNVTTVVTLDRLQSRLRLWFECAGSSCP